MLWGSIPYRKTAPKTPPESPFRSRPIALETENALPSPEVDRPKPESVPGVLSNGGKIDTFVPK